MTFRLLFSRETIFAYQPEEIETILQLSTAENGTIAMNSVKRYYSYQQQETNL